jgi:hypothetical protein
MTTLRTDQDSPWKHILRQYFHEAMEFFFPDVAKVVDWQQPIEFLDKEFQQITPEAEIGKRYADQLVKVHRKRGKPLILLIHLEIQATPDKNFAERMFIYAVRIFEFFHQPPPVSPSSATPAPTGDPAITASPPPAAPSNSTSLPSSSSTTKPNGHS